MKKKIIYIACAVIIIAFVIFASQLINKNNNGNTEIIRNDSFISENLINDKAETDGTTGLDIESTTNTVQNKTEDSIITHSFTNKIPASDENWIVSGLLEYFDNYAGSREPKTYKIINTTYFCPEESLILEFDMKTEGIKENSFFVGIRQNLQEFSAYDNDGIWLCFFKSKIGIMTSDMESIYYFDTTVLLDENNFETIRITDDKSNNTVTVSTGDGAEVIKIRILDGDMTEADVYNASKRATTHISFDRKIYTGGYSILWSNEAKNTFLSRIAIKKY